MRDPDPLRVVYETGNPAVGWETFRKRVKRLGWGEYEALNTPPGKRWDKVAPQLEQLGAVAQVSERTIRERMKNDNFSKKYANWDTRLRKAVKNQPYNWPEPGNTYNGWVLVNVIRSSCKKQGPGVRATVYCERCRQIREYLLKYLRKGKAKPCRCARQQ